MLGVPCRQLIPHILLLCLIADFENTLKAMGFAVESTSSLGHVAKIDLTPHKQKAANGERSREVKSEKVAGGRTKITVEERKVTSTTFNGDKVTVNCNTLFVPLAGETSNQESKTPPMKPNYSSTLLKATQSASASASRTPSNGASSIYNLIKKGGATPANTTPMRNMNNDLNDSSSSFEDEPAPRPVVMREKKATPQHHRSQIPSTASSEYRLVFNQVRSHSHVHLVNVDWIFSLSHVI